MKKRVSHCLAALQRRKLTHPVKGVAAVLMPIVQRDGEPRFLLTKRTQSVSTHKGQISFPGGLREDHDDSLLATALRETEEEIGLPPEQVEVVGRFHDYLSITEWLVAPFVGFLSEDYQCRPNPGEVERVLEIPVGFFEEANPRVETRERFGRVIPVYFYDYRGEVVWGLTAAMIRDFVLTLESLKV